MYVLQIIDENGLQSFSYKMSYITYEFLYFS